MTRGITQTVRQDERELLTLLRSLRKEERQRAMPGPAARLTPGQHVADIVAAGMGSWRFIIIQTAMLVLWIVLNVTAAVQQWDPYPFILLNLALSFQAAYAAPFIMMSQNRQAAIDRAEAGYDHKINIKAELEIELLHQKIDDLRSKEVLALTEAVRNLTSLLERQQPPGGMAAAPGPAST